MPSKSRHWQSPSGIPFVHPGRRVLLGALLHALECPEDHNPLLGCHHMDGFGLAAKLRQLAELELRLAELFSDAAGGSLQAGQLILNHPILTQDGAQLNWCRLPSRIHVPSESRSPQTIAIAT